MCIIIDFDKCEKTVYQSFLEKNCSNQTTFEKGLELRADVEQAVTEEFELPRSNGSGSWKYPFNPNAKYQSQYQWKKSGQLRQPHQCAKCGLQYESENHAYLHHMENCKHPTVLFTSALRLLQLLPVNSPQTVKEDSKSKKKLEQRTKERRQRFITNKGNFHRLQNNLHK